MTLVPTVSCDIVLPRHTIAVTRERTPHLIREKIYFKK